MITAENEKEAKNGSKRTFFSSSEQLIKYTVWLQRLGYAASSIKGNTRRLKEFFDWLEQNNLTIITQQQIRDYKSYLDQRTNRNLGYSGLSASYINSYLNAIELYNKYLQLTTESSFITEKLDKYPKQEFTADVLTRSEIQQLYQATDNSLLGYRNRAILAVYYGCGLRASEGIRLRVKDIYQERKLLYVRPGKTKTDRYVPMSERVAADLKDYLTYTRESLLNCTTDKLLLSYFGKPFRSANNINQILKRLAGKTSISKRVYPHLLRHSIATHLLQSGMDFEQIARFLGHKSMQTTTMYAQVLKL